MNAVAGAPPDGTPVIVSGSGRTDVNGTVRVWRLTDGSPLGEPLIGHYGSVNAVAVGALPNGTPMIVSGGYDRTVRVWRLTDGSSLGPLIHLPAAVSCLALHHHEVVVGAHTDIALLQPTFQ